jgi:hypothetical protein
MRRFQIIRIIGLLAAIFLAGAITGRLTMARPPASITTVGGQIVTADLMLQRMTRQLELDAAQQARIRPLLDGALDASSKVPALSQERLDIFRSCMARVRECLRTEQYAEFDRMVRLKERQFERMLRDKR